MKKDPILEYFLIKNKKEILFDLSRYPQEIKILSIYPDFQILDYIEIMNSNIAIVLLQKYDIKLVEFIKKELNWDKIKAKLLEPPKQKDLDKAREEIKKNRENYTPEDPKKT